MNILFLTQSGSFELFYDVLGELQKSCSIEQAGFYVTDQKNYEHFVAEKNIQLNEQFIVKDWEFYQKAVATRLDEEILKKYESEIGDPCLWSAVVAERRLYFGKKYSYDQDYVPQADDLKMKTVLQVACQEMDALFERLKPDLVVSFQCVSLGEYLGYLFAKHKNIPFINLRPTRIENYIYGGESIFEPSKVLQEAYEEKLKNGLSSEELKRVEAYLAFSRGEHALYEGVVAPSLKPPGRVKKRIKKLNPILKLFEIIRDEYDYRYGRYKYDSHSSGVIKKMIFQKVFRKIRAKRIHQKLLSQYVKRSQLKDLNYAFFPLHTEPEVTVSVYSKPYLNQIEAIRLLSHNLPIGMSLIVKEHPWSIGKRPLGYYEKILSIPNVRLALPSLTSRELVSHSKLVAVIAGSIGYEGLILRKPTIVLSHTPYNFLSSTMLHVCHDPFQLGREINRALYYHQHDEESLKTYIATTMDLSVPVDMYSCLLRRDNSISWEGTTNTDKRSQHIIKLTNYLMKTYERRVGIIMS